MERVVKPEWEQRLLNVQLTHPRGDWDIWRDNNEKWMDVLNQYLVGRCIMFSINGGNYRY